MKIKKTHLIWGIVFIAIITVLLIMNNNSNQPTKVILETSKGEITLELYNNMPITAGNFEKLVLEGVPFRVTHKIAGILVQLAHQSKKPISKLTPTEIKKSVIDTKVDSKTVSKIISSTTVITSLKDRKSYGSSGYAEQKRMISDRIQMINNYRTIMTARENKINSSISDLEKQVNKLIQ